MNYLEANRVLNKARLRWRGKKVANNTRLVEVDGNKIGVRLHSTNVVVFCRDGCVVLNSGGWRTVTTKARINSYAPCQVYQRQGQWRVVFQGTVHRFRDGMRLQADGKVSYGLPIG